MSLGKITLVVVGRIEWMMAGLLLEAQKLFIALVYDIMLLFIRLLMVSQAMLQAPSLSRAFTTTVNLSLPLERQDGMEV